MMMENARLDFLMLFDLRDVMATAVEHRAQVQSKLPGALHKKTSCNSEKEKASHDQCSAISVLKCEGWA